MSVYNGDGATIADIYGDNSDDVSSMMRRYAYFHCNNPESNQNAPQPTKFSLFAKKHPGIANFITHRKFQNACLFLAIAAGMSLLPLVLICPGTWLSIIAMSIMVIACHSFFISGILASNMRETRAMPSCK